MLEKQITKSPELEATLARAFESFVDGNKANALGVLRASGLESEQVDALMQAFLTGGLLEAEKLLVSSEPDAALLDDEAEVEEFSKLATEQIRRESEQRKLVTTPPASSLRRVLESVDKAFAASLDQSLIRRSAANLETPLEELDGCFAERSYSIKATAEEKKAIGKETLMIFSARPNVFLLHIDYRLEQDADQVQVSLTALSPEGEILGALKSVADSEVAQGFSFGLAVPDSLSKDPKLSVKAWETFSATLNAEKDLRLFFLRSVFPARNELENGLRPIPGFQALDVSAAEHWQIQSWS